MEDQELDSQSASGDAELSIQNPKSKIQNGFVPLASIGARASSRIDLGAIRERLAGARGRQYWQSLEELAETDEFLRYMEREFPNQAPRDMAPLGRREFFRVMGATLALAGVGGCAYQPPEKIVPYVEQPEQMVPGKALFYTTAFQRSGYAIGLLGTSNMGRPTKLEGNPDHPASLGATDAITQASLLTLYDPDRSQAVRHFGNPSTWDEFLGEMTDRLDALHRSRGAGLRVLTGTVTSPTMTGQLRRLLALFPEAKLHQHEPAGRDSVREGARLAFGDEVNPVYQLDRAQVILSLDSDFLFEEPGSVRYARHFIDGRRVRKGRTQMNRLYVVESTSTITGANADHRLRLRPSQVEGFARALAAAVGAPGAGGGAPTPPEGVPPAWIPALAKDLQGQRGSSVVIAGMGQPPVVHALAHAMNQALGNIGKTVTFTPPVEEHFGSREGTLQELVNDMKAGSVDTLVILGSNPVYTAPADLNFAAAMEERATDRRDKVPFRIHLGLYDNETSALCHWHIPESHYLEAWSDARAFDGTTSIVQPLITPLYDSRSAHELVAVLLGEGDRYGYDIVREYWMGQNPTFAPPARRGATGAPAAAGGAGGVTPGAAFMTNVSAGSALSQPSYPSAAAPVSPAFEKFWNQALIKGFISGSQAPVRSVTVRPGFASAAPAPATGTGGMEIVFRPDPTIWDGRYANNGWLQELPKPLTSLTWDNAALISPVTAEAEKLNDGDVVELTCHGNTLPAAVMITPGHPDGVVTLTLGYGRPRAGRVGTGTGFNAYALRTSDALGFGTGLQVKKTSGNYQLVTAQTHMSTEGRDLVRAGNLSEFTANPEAPAFMLAEEEHPALYPQMWPSDRLNPREPVAGFEARGYDDRPIPAWGMVIDVNACIGCNACTAACQAENNIATVGKSEVAKHRQMHWIRIDNYFSGAAEDPRVAFEPVPCMQCEKAPCESVCPVEATTHSAEGLNEQTYNRCVGTRYCSNNCPYKVRRYNFLQYSNQSEPTIQMLANPNVTVRSRGVMEKCTYCVQRINEARIQAEKEDREIQDGDIVPACAQVCPTRAIVFGNINDKTSDNGKGSQVRQLKTEPLNYALLTELNTRPRTTYLARLRNPNPELGSSG
jgi:molybdopterin-containing oxidoreductase family iron-sulfur binding subunit